jgi:hypothetical protein
MVLESIFNRDELMFKNAASEPVKTKNENKSSAYSVFKTLNGDVGST